jgi:hypothetical protein
MVGHWPCVICAACPLLARARDRSQTRRRIA